MPRKTRRSYKKKRNKKTRKKKLSVSRRKLNYYKKKFRKFTKNYKKTRSSLKKSRKLKGGSKSNFTYGCRYPKNIGSIMSGYKNNTNPFLPDPNPLNSNLKGNVNMRGGGFLYDFGLGDLLNNYYKATDFGKNIWHRYKGNKKEVPVNTTYQPELRKNVTPEYSTADLPKYYEVSTDKAAKNTIV